MDEKMILKKIGNRIQILRKQKGFTQLTFSEAIGLSNNYLSQIERGGSFPRVDKFVAIMNTLECSADDIFCDVIDYGCKVKASQISEKLEQIPSEDQTKILKIIDIFTDNSN